MTVDELSRKLLDLRLVEPAQLEECQAQTGSRTRHPSELLDQLLRAQYLTSFQLSKIKSGDADGLVLGGYKLMYRNASGSFARVYRACSITDGKMIGVKVLRRRWARDPESIDQFRREAELGKRLKHKNITPIYDVGSKGDLHYFTMEFIEGGNLREFVRIRKKLGPIEAAGFILDVAEGLEYALSKGVTHRDLKMTNVLMSSRGIAMLIDFGLALDENMIAHYDNGDMPRTLEYNTLERGTGAPHDDPRTDLFFLGAIFYELVTGVPPYPRSRRREERTRLSRYQNIQPVRTHDPNLPADVQRIVEKLTEFKPERRYQTPTELVADLRLVLRRADDSPVGGNSRLPTGESDKRSTIGRVMCVETRAKHQDILREYLSEKGFRVLMIRDVYRALERMKKDGPECVVLMGGGIGVHMDEAVPQVIQLAKSQKFAAVIVLEDKQRDLLEQRTVEQHIRFLVQPVTALDVRRQIRLAMLHQRDNA